MSPSEELDLLRREVADLRDRVRMLEGRPTFLHTPQPYVPTLPYTVPQPYVPPLWTAPWSCGAATAVDPNAQSWG